MTVVRGERGGTDLLLLLADLDTHLLLDEEARDSLVSLAGVSVGEDLPEYSQDEGEGNARRIMAHEEDLSSSRVGDPHLRSFVSPNSTLHDMMRTLDPERV